MMDRFERFLLCLIGVLLLTLFSLVFYSLYGWANESRCLEMGYEKIEVMPDLTMYCVGIDGQTRTSTLKLED